MKALQPTASKTALLLACQRPFWTSPEKAAEEAEEEAPRPEPSPEAAYGIEFHEWMAEAARGKPWPIVGHSMRAHVERSAKALMAWLRPDGNIWSSAMSAWAIEQPCTMRLDHPKSPYGSVNTEADTEYTSSKHEYANGRLALTEMGLTPDLVAASKGNPNFKVILDHKTGRYEADPAEDPQLLTLALAFGARGVAVMATPPDAEPMMLQADVSPQRLDQHRRDLRRALLRRGPAMNPGPHCDEQYCPRRAVCPAYAGVGIAAASQTAQAALARGSGPFDLLPSVDPGTFHDFLGQLEKLVAWGRAELRERVRAGEIIEKRDGKVLTLSERTRRSLASLSELEKRAPELLRQLEQAGLVRETTYEEMRAK